MSGRCQDYAKNSSLEAFRETWGHVRGILTDIATLPTTVPLLKDFDACLKNDGRDQSFRTVGKMRPIPQAAQCPTYRRWRGRS